MSGGPSYFKTNGEPKPLLSLLGAIVATCAAQLRKPFDTEPALNQFLGGQLSEAVAIYEISGRCQLETIEQM